MYIYIYMYIYRVYNRVHLLDMHIARRVQLPAASSPPLESDIVFSWADEHREGHFLRVRRPFTHPGPRFQKMTSMHI